MKKGVAVFVCVIALSCPSFVLGQFGMGCCTSGLADASCLTVANVGFVPSLGFGYQSQGLNLDFSSQQYQLLFDADKNMSLKNNSLWIAALGLDVAVRQKLRFYGVASTNLFVSKGVEFDGLNYRNIGGYVPWSSNEIRWWELNLGGLYCLTQNDAILVGFKGDSLTANLSRNQENLGGGTIYSFFGDFKVITRSPYIGVKICRSYSDFSLVWSPWLTSYDVKIPLGSFDSPPHDTWRSTQDSYQLSGGGGQLFEAFAQTKLNIREVLGVNLWLKASWLQCRGSGNMVWTVDNGDTDTLNYSNCSLTRSLWALGISGSLTF